jgi:integrase
MGHYQSFRPDQAAQERRSPTVGYLQAHDLARLLDFLSLSQATYGESLTYHLAVALFYTCSRYTEIACLRWNDCLLDGSGRAVAVRIKGKGSQHRTLSVNPVLAELFGQWRTTKGSTGA